MPDEPNPVVIGRVRMWVAPEPKYHSRIAQAAPIVSLAAYFAVLFVLSAAGTRTIVAALIACPIGVSVAWAWCFILYRRWRRQWEAWFTAEARRRSAERLAAFDAHVRALRIFSDRPQG